MNRKVISTIIIFVMILMYTSYVSAVGVQGITLNKTNVRLEVGQSDQLIATVSPENATNKQVSWASSNLGVVSVNASGQIKGISEGIATITATTIDKGYRVTATVVVSKDSAVASDKYAISKDKDSLGADITYITKIAPKTMVQTFKKNIATYTSYKIYNLSNKEVSETDVVTTGMKMKFEGGAEYVLSVTTDVNSDGKLSVSDMTRLKLFMTKIITLDDPQIKAADVNYDGRISTTDMTRLKQIMVGVIQI